MRRRSDRPSSGPSRARRPTDRGRRRRVPIAAVAALAMVAGIGVPRVAAQTSPSGSPVPIHFVNLDATSSTVGARQGVTAAVEEVNRTGGIGGRPVTVTECRTEQTTDTGRACIDQAVTARAAVVFGVQPGTASDHLPTLSAAGIPYVGQTCNTSTTLGGQYLSFCFGSDFVGLYSSGANHLKSLGTVQSAALPFVDVPAAATGMRAYADPTMQRAGITPIEVPIPEGTADVAPTLGPVLQANAPGAVIALLTGPGCVSTMQLRHQQAATVPYLFPAMCTDPDVVGDGGPGAKGAQFVRQTVALDRKDADVRTYRRAMARFAPKADPADVYVQAGFAGIMNLAAALRSVPSGTTIDAATATAALRAATQVPMFLTPGGSFTCDGTAFPGLRSLCSVQAHVLQYRGKGRWTDQGLF